MTSNSFVIPKPDFVERFNHRDKRCSCYYNNPTPCALVIYEQTTQATILESIALLMTPEEPSPSDITAHYEYRCLCHNSRNRSNCIFIQNTLHQKLQTQLQLMSERSSELKKGASTEENFKLNAHIKELDLHLSESKAENEKLQQKVATLQSAQIQIKDLESIISQNKSREDKLRKMVCTLQQDLQTQASAYKERAAKTTFIIQNLQSENGKLISENKDFKSELSKENGRFKSKHELDSQTILKLRAEVDHVKTQTETLTREFEKRISDLKHELEVKTNVFDCQRKTFLNKIENVDKAKQDDVSTGSCFIPPKPNEILKSKMVSVGIQTSFTEGKSKQVLSPDIPSHTVEKKTSSPKTPKVSKPKKPYPTSKRVYLSSQTNVNRPFMETTYGKNGEITGFRDQYGWFAHKPKKIVSTKTSVGTQQTPVTKVDPVSEKPNKKLIPKTDFSTTSTSYTPKRYSFDELLSFKQSKSKDVAFQMRPSNLFFKDTPRIKPKWNAFSISQIDNAYKWHSKSFSK